MEFAKRRVGVFLAFLIMAVAMTVLSASARGSVGGGQELSPVPVDDYFVVTRVDARRCAAPECGGYFVKRVNTDVAPCADGTWRAECHAYRIQFPGGAVPGPEPVIKTLDDGRPVDLQEALSQRGRVIMRGELKRVPVDKGVNANVLVAGEMWLGRYGHEPSRGHFSRLDPLMITCITYPCASYVERGLNTNLVDFLAGVSFDAPAIPLDESTEFLPVRGSVLAVGTHSTVTGPGGSMNMLRVREIYDPLFFISGNDDPGALRTPAAARF